MAKLIETQTLFYSNCPNLKVSHLKVYHGLVCMQYYQTLGVGPLKLIETPTLFYLKIIFLFSIDSSIASCYYANLCHVSLLLPYLLTGTIVYGV